MTRTRDGMTTFIAKGILALVWGLAAILIWLGVYEPATWFVGGMALFIGLDRALDAAEARLRYYQKRRDQAIREGRQI